MKVLSTADVVVDETYSLDPAAYDLAAFKAEYGLDGEPKVAAPWLEDGRIFRTDGRISSTNGSDWFEGAIARPDLVLEDMVRVVDSARDADVSQEYRWLRNVAEPAKVIGADACERKSTCDAAPTPICPFVSVCADGSLTVLRDDAADALTCSYEACSLAGAPAHTAQMAAPAVILLTVLIVFVEALINFC